MQYILRNYSGGFFILTKEIYIIMKKFKPNILYILAVIILGISIRIDSDHMILDKRIRNLDNDDYNFLAYTIHKFIDLYEKKHDIK